MRKSKVWADLLPGRSRSRVSSGARLAAAGAGRAWSLALVAALVLAAGCAERDSSVLIPDTTPPVTSGLDYASGRVSWITDEATDCVLLYGSARGDYDHYGYNVADGGADHYVDLIDIGAGAYYFKAMATDRAGNVSYSAETTFTVAGPPAAETMVYTMIDVGWGDSHFLEFPGGAKVLIDAGSSEHADDVSGFLNTKQIAKPSGITYMIGTHAHADHYGGFRGSVLVFYNDTEFLAPERPSVSVWPYLNEFLVPAGIPTHGLVEGQSSDNTEFLDWDPAHGVKVKVLSAGAGRLANPAQEVDSVNCDSAVLKVSYGAVDFLLTGDAEEFTEDLMIKNHGQDLACEVLKVAHHGNDDATSELFLQRVRPRVAVISNSLAENDGVFKQSVLNLLRQYGADYYATDRVYMNAARSAEPRYGNLTVTTDGMTYVVGSWK
ncbi:MAG: MBL fold metallo-hydrolase [bacterium]